MKGLEGEADSDNNNIVTVTELSDFVEKKVSLENYKAFGERQSPKVHLMGQDFPLTGGMVKDVGKEFYEQGVAYEKLGEIALAKEWYGYAASQNYSSANGALKKIEKIAVKERKNESSVAISDEFVLVDGGTFQMEKKLESER